MMAEMDLVAAAAVSRFLYDSPNGVSEALTVGFDKGTFHKGAQSGDLVIFTATITGVGKKRVSVKVVAERERLDTCYQEVEHDKNDPPDFVGCVFESKKKLMRDKMAEAMFHFCAYDMKLKKGVEHGMTMPTHTVFLEQYEPESSIINPIYIFDTKGHAERYVNRLNQIRGHKFCEHWSMEEFKLEHAGLPLNPAVPGWDGEEDEEAEKPVPPPIPLLPKPMNVFIPKPVCPAIAEIPDEYPDTVRTYVNIEPDL